MPTSHHDNRHNNTNRPRSEEGDWRCRKCFKLLGCRSEGRVHVEFARGHRYILSTPVTAVCRCCGTLNELPRTH